MEPAVGRAFLPAYTHTDISRFVVIGALTFSISIVAALALERDPATIAPQLFYIPVLYAAYYYPKAGLAVAGACAIVYELIGSFFAFPDPARAGFVILQGILFVAAGTLVASLSETIRSGTADREALMTTIERDNRSRRGVVCTLAHELRTPLQPLMGYLNLLLSDPDGFSLTPETQKILARCLTSVERERQIINQMLEFSVLEAGKIKPDYSVFKVNEMLASLIQDGGYASHAEIAIDVPQDLSFEADASKFRTVINSMVSNAISYSRPPRRVRIMYHPAESGSFHKISISDNGIGIPSDQLDAIFEPFQLADSDKLSRKYDRIGLSLSIAMKYINLHGGTITVESKVNSGTTFTISIPKIPPAGREVR